jgi:hypothetical protein
MIMYFTPLFEQLDLLAKQGSNQPDGELVTQERMTSYQGALVVSLRKAREWPLACGACTQSSARGTRLRIPFDSDAHAQITGQGVL